MGVNVTIIQRLLQHTDSWRIRIVRNLMSIRDFSKLGRVYKNTDDFIGFNLSLYLVENS